MLIFVTAVTVALTVSFLCSIFESVLLSVSPARVEALANEGKRSGSILRDFKQHIDVPIAAILIVNTIAHTIGATVAGASYADVFSEESLWIFSLVFTVAVLLLTEIIPKTLGVTFASALATPVAYSIRYLTIALRPFVALASMISRSLRGSHDAQVTSIEEIRLLTAIGRNEGVVGAKTAGIIDSATRLHQLDAADVLVPRSRVIYLSGEQSTDEVLEVIRESGHSRFPFTSTGAMDDVSGVVMAKDLLFELRKDETLDWQKVLRQPIFVPETQPLNKLLQMFRDERRHMAIVVDEYGTPQGIVTLEDVLEELVGDIVDESDRPTEEVRRRDDGSFDVLASIELRRLCKLLDVPMDPDEDVVTLSGLLLESLDRVPRAGDVIHWQGYVFQVLQASDTRAEVVRAMRDTEKAEPPAGEP